jgi:hypothetical protein
MLSILSEQGVPPPPRLSTKLGRLPIAGLNLKNYEIKIYSCHGQLIFLCETSMIGRKVKLLARRANEKNLAYLERRGEPPMIVWRLLKLLLPSVGLPG